MFIKIPTEQARNTPGVSFYTNTSWLREGWSVWGSLQGRGPETSRGRRAGVTAGRSPLFWCLSCARRSDRASWIHPSVLVLCFFFWRLQDLEKKINKRMRRGYINTREAYKSGFMLWLNKLKVLHLKGAHEGLVHTHHAACVVKLPAVVGGWEQGHQLSFGKELITVFNNLEGGRKRAETISLSSLTDIDCRPIIEAKLPKKQLVLALSTQIFSVLYDSTLNAFCFFENIEKKQIKYVHLAPNCDWNMLILVLWKLIKLNQKVIKVH